MPENFLQIPIFHNWDSLRNMENSGLRLKSLPEDFCLFSTFMGFKKIDLKRVSIRELWVSVRARFSSVICYLKQINNIDNKARGFYNSVIAFYLNEFFMFNVCADIFFFKFYLRSINLLINVK